MSLQRYVLLIITAGLLVPGTDLSAQIPEGQYPFVNELVSPVGGQFHTVKLDATGTPHIVYWDTTADRVKYAVRVNGVWIEESPAPAIQGGDHCDLALDSQGNPHICFYDFTNDQLRYATKSGGVWSSEAVGVATGVGVHNSIVTDSQDRPHIAFQDYSNANLEYAIKNGSWNVTTVDDTNNVGQFTSIALDTQDNPHILYLDVTEDDIYHAWKLNGPWNIYPVTTGGDAFERPTALEIDAQNVLHAFYTREGSGPPLFLPDTGNYAFSFDFASWSETEVFLAAYTDFTLDAGGNPHFATNAFGLVIHGVLIEDSLSTSFVDAVGNSNFQTSIDVDHLGNPVVSYFYDTTNDVRFGDSRVRLTSPNAGAMWAVGSEQTISWEGAGVVDVLLSTDGGASYNRIAESRGGLDRDTGEHVFTVPHTPSRFCKVKIRRDEPLSVSTSDSLFTIETSIALLAFTISLGEVSGGNELAWRTDPGPPDLAGYRLDRQRDDASWATLVALTRETSYADNDGRPGDRYRLFGVNGLGQELLLGEASSGPQVPPRLSAWPQPYTGGELSVSFATGSLGGVPIPTEVALYDVAGRLVRVLVRDTFASHVQLIGWDGRDRAGNPVPSGVYFLRATSGPLQQTQKVVIVR